MIKLDEKDWVKFKSTKLDEKLIKFEKHDINLIKLVYNYNTIY